MLMMQKCFPYMKEQGYGRIINCSTPSVIEGTPGQTAYVMSKGAIDALTRAASQEWGPYGITTNNFLPTIKTENFDKSDRDGNMPGRWPRRIPCGISAHRLKTAPL